MIKFFIDTCIYRDYIERRKSKQGKDIGILAENFFLYIILRKTTVIISDFIIKELNSKYNQSQMSRLNILFSKIIKFEKISTEKKDIRKARDLSEKLNLPIVDCLIAIQAKKSNAIVITRDMHILKNLKHICSAKLPESIIQ